MVGLSFGKAIALAPATAAGRGQPPGGPCGLGAAGGGRRLSLPAAAGLRRPLPAAGGGRASAPAGGWARPSTTRPARPSTRSPRRWACPTPAARRWSGWPRAATPRASRCPALLLGREDCDFSFSGLKTAAARLARPKTVTSRTMRAPDLAAAVQAAIARQLADAATGRWPPMASAHGAGDRRFVVAGGVAANRAVRARAGRGARRRAASASPPRRSTTAPTTPP